MYHLTDPVRAGREVPQPCESGGLMRDWQLLTGSGCPHDGVSVIECAVCCSSVTALPPPPGGRVPHVAAPRLLSLAPPPSRSFPRPSVGVGAAACVCVLVPLVTLHDKPHSVFARFVLHSWDQTAWRERRGWIPLQSGFAPAEHRGEYRLAWSHGGTEPTPREWGVSASLEVGRGSPRQQRT